VWQPAQTLWNTGETSLLKDFTAPLQSGVKFGLVELLLQAPIRAEQTIRQNIIFFMGCNDI